MSPSGSSSPRWKVPQGLAFPMPLPVEVGGEMRTVEIGAEGAVIAVPEGQELRIDPDFKVLRAS